MSAEKASVAADLLEKANSLIATLKGQTDHRTDECNAWFREYQDFRRPIAQARPASREGQIICTNCNRPHEPGECEFNRDGSRKIAQARSVEPLLSERSDSSQTLTDAGARLADEALFASTKLEYELPLSNEPAFTVTDDLIKRLEKCTPLFWKTYLGGKEIQESGIIISAELREQICTSLRAFGHGAVTDEVVEAAEIAYEQHNSMGMAIEAALRAMPASERDDDTTGGYAGRKWRCFHCDEVFSEKDEAAAHFGWSEMDTPACRVDGTLAYAFRQQEAELRAYRQEDTRLIQEFYELASRHASEKAEWGDKEYAKGYADARAESASERDAVIEKCAKALLGKIEGGHCGEGTAEIIARQSRNAVLRECAEIVLALKSPPAKSQEGA